MSTLSARVFNESVVSDVMIYNLFEREVWDSLLRTNCCSIRLFTYACPVWSSIAASTNLKCLETLQNKAVELSLGLPIGTATEFIDDETGLPRIEEHMQSVTDRFYKPARGLTEYSFVSWQVCRMVVATP